MVFVIAIAVSLSGCVSLLSPPSLEEQAAALQAAELSQTTRFAVVSRGDNWHTSELHPVGDEIASRIAEVVTTSLGIDAVALSSAEGSPWSNELARAHKATGLITASDNRDFFRTSGFDGYVLITLYDKIEYYDRPEKAGSKRMFFTYDPVFHMIALPPDEERVLLMQAGLSGRFSCEMDGDRLKSKTDCVDTFVKRFRRALDSRLEQNSPDERTS